MQEYKMQEYNMGEGTIQTTFQIAQLITAFAGIALYNVVELMVLIALTFRRRHGLYFWSLVISTVAIVPYTLGLLFKFFGVVRVTMLCISLIDVGWQCMSVGQSVVLYSRLHLVASSKKKLHWIFAIIIANFFISNVPTTVFVFATTAGYGEPFLKLYAVWERLQLCCYFVQETTISGLYIHEITRILKLEVYNNLSTEGVSAGDQEMGSVTMPRRMRSQKGRRVMKHLLYVNIVIVILDVTLLVSEFIGQFNIQVLYKAAVYSMKLKLEFRILNQLTEIAQEKLRTSQAYFSAQSETISMASPMTTSAGEITRAWSTNGSPGEKTDMVIRRGNHAAHLIARARTSLGCGSTSSRRFSQPERRMTNIDEKTADGTSSSFSRPSLVRAVTAPTGESVLYKKHSLRLST